MTVTVIGDAFIDIAVPIYSTKKGETYHRKLAISCGGTANVAIQISRLGERSKFVAKVGNDALGKYFKQNLRRNRVADLTLLDDNHPTGLCVALVQLGGYG